MQTSKLWTKNFVLCIAVNFFLVLNYYLLITVISQYAMEEYHASVAMAGFASSIFVIGILIARFFSGYLIESMGKRKMVFFGTILAFVMSGAYLLVRQIALLMLVRFVHGLAYGTVATSVGTVATSIVPENRRGEGIGYYMLSNTLGAAIGPFCSLFFIGHGGFQTIFFVCILTAALGFIGSIPLNIADESPSERLSGRKGSGRGKQLQLNRFFETRAIPISLICALIYFCYSSLLSFLMPYSINIGQETAAQYYFTIYAVAILLSRPFTGKLFDTKGEWITMVPGMVGFSIGMILLSQANSAALLLASAAFVGFGVGINQSAGLASAVNAANGENLSKVNATFYMFADLAVGIGPFFLGNLLTGIGYRTMYLAMAAVAVVGIFLYHTLVYRRKSTAIDMNEESCI